MNLRTNNGKPKTMSDTFIDYSNDRMRQVAAIDVAMHVPSPTYYPQDKCYVIRDVLSKQKEGLEQVLGEQISWDRFDWLMQGVSSKLRNTQQYKDILDLVFKNRKDKDKEVTKTVQTIWMQYACLMLSQMVLPIKFTTGDCISMFRYYIDRYREEERLHDAATNRTHE